MAISKATTQLLWVKAAGRCSMPNCRRELVIEATAVDPHVLIGERAHIVGRSDEKGPRFEFPVPGGERDGYENLILLCPDCHTKVDRQEKTYTVDRLLQIKADHEQWVRERLTPEQRFLEATPVRPDTTETVHSTLLWVEMMPKHIYTAPCELDEPDVRPKIRGASPDVMLPYIVREKKVITFVDLTNKHNVFRDAISDIGAAERHQSTEWWKDQDLSSWYVSLLNRLLNKVCGRRNLHLDKEHQRYYFEPLPPETEGGEPLPREVQYMPLNRVRSSKLVAWRPTFRKSGEAKNYWEHLAVGLRFHRMAPDRWAFSIRPERRFTQDGFIPLTPKGTGRRSGSKKARMYNVDLLTELQFWRDYLTDGGQRLIANLGEQSLIIDGTLMAADVCWPGVPDDSITFRNAEVEDDLFTSAAYHAALEQGADSVDFYEWEPDVPEEFEEELPSTERY